MRLRRDPVTPTQPGAGVPFVIHDGPSVTDPKETDITKIMYKALLFIHAGAVDPCTRVKFYDLSGSISSVSDPCHAVKIAGEALDRVHALHGDSLLEELERQ